MNNYLKISPLGLGMALGLVWLMSIVIISLLAMYVGYGVALVDLLATVYSGYELSAIGILIGAGWSFLDGFIGGGLIAFFYNLFVRG